MPPPRCVKKQQLDNGNWRGNEIITLNVFSVVQLCSFDLDEDRLKVGHDIGLNRLPL